MCLTSPARLALVLLSAASLLIAIPAFADSQVRIVRLSDVQGSVQINKNSGLGFESAFVNLPITQGTRLKTLSNGRAEVEFEDGSTLRLAPDTIVQFSTLGSSDAGKHTSVINLEEGMAYVDWIGKSGDEIGVDFSHEKLLLDREAHFRLDTSTDAARLAVFKGNVDVESPSGQVSVEKNKTATFNMADDKCAITNHIAEEPLDSWDKESIEYHDQYAKKNTAPYGYGASDLGYYGAYNNVPGYGMMWQPYFMGAGWDPFMDGAWSWYPGMGYMFISAYPWGWMPYMYGNWNFVPGYGWGWMPGGWNTWNAMPRYGGGTGVHMHPLVAPTGSVKTVAVGRGGPGSSVSSSAMVLRAGTAGLGVPRGSLDNLHRLNSQVAKKGYATPFPARQFGATAARNSSFGPGFGGEHGEARGAERGGYEGHSSMETGHVSSPSVGHAAPSGGGAHR
jgi:hypothetical protein